MKPLALYLTCVFIGVCALLLIVTIIDPAQPALLVDQGG